MNDDSGFIPPDGSYEAPIGLRKAEVVHDCACRFCHKFLAKGGRAIDQMIQAARSGKQNLLEGRKASATSTEMDIPLCLTHPSSQVITLTRDLIGNSPRAKLVSGGGPG